MAPFENPAIRGLKVSEKFPGFNKSKTYPLLLSGLDTLEVSYFVNVPSSDLDLEDLEYRKEVSVR